MTEPRENITILCPHCAPKPRPDLQRQTAASFVGLYVKRAFPVEESRHMEHLWVMVTGVSPDGQLIGQVSNEPDLEVGYLLGDSVTFPVSDAEDVRL
jgi:uncharacterized protein YegJ (DUF2314 family)